ncbi:MAG: AAA family ATPase [Phycisphaerales bacterium]|nr:AAA family ATPase [Phycisphaerales bacterium]
MTSEHPTSESNRSRPFSDEIAGDEERLDARESLWVVVDDRLRGRWRRMIIVGLVLAAALAFGGFASTVPSYRSTGAIHVAPRLPVTLTPIPETGELDHFVSFVATQVQLIRSRRVFEHALEDETLKDTDWGRDPRALERLEEDIDVTSDRNSELIFVAFEADSPKIAQIVVNAVIGAYEDIYGRSGADEVARTLQRLKDLQGQLNRDLRSTRAEIQRLRTKHDGGDVTEAQGAVLREIDVVEAWIDDARQLIDEARAAGVYRMGGTGPSAETIAALDPQLAEYRRLRDEAETAFQFVTQRYRPDSPPFRRAEDRFRTADQLYHEQLVVAIEVWGRTGRLGSIDVASLATVLTPDQVEHQIDAMEHRAENLRAAAEQMVADLRQLEELDGTARRLQADFDQTIARIKQLEVEESSVRGGRISVAQLGSRPLSVYSDGRRKRALFGGVFGIMLSFGLYFLLGTVDRRAFAVRQLEHAVPGGGLTCLGVVPDLERTDRRAEGDPTEVASHCMHHIRNAIEAARTTKGGTVLAVSSPFQGDGKTSIAVALGMSYALAGYRTVIVDGDLIGRSLTRQMGHVGSRGLKECLLGEATLAEAVAASVNDLAVLPVGAAKHFGPERIRREELEVVLARLRERYEMIIVDTGPVLGSLECLPIMGAADSAMLIVRRGRSCTRLGECVERIESTGSPCLGVVLNCAPARECERYTSETSLVGDDGATSAPPPNPLVRAVSEAGRDAA